MDQLKKDELLQLCKKKGLKVNKNMNKTTLKEMIGGRYYKCYKNGQIQFVEKSSNPQYIGKYKGWICEETNLSSNKNKSGCSYGLQPGKRCIPCTPAKKKSTPKVCRGCVKGKNVFYCYDS